MTKAPRRPTHAGPADDPSTHRLARMTFSGADLDEVVKSVARFLRSLPPPMAIDAAPLAKDLEDANTRYNIAATKG